MAFFGSLDKAIINEYRVRLPNLESGYRKNTQRWFSHCEKMLEETLLDSDLWFNHWVSVSVPTPTEADKQEVKCLNDNALNYILLCLSVSLKHLILEDYEAEPFTEYLHQYWLIADSECKRRGFESVSYDPFELDVKAKNEGKLINGEKLWEKARIEGSICPHCQSDNVRSYNKGEWKCYSCNKRFRKH